LAYWRPLGAWANLKTDDGTACLRRLRTWRTPIYAIVRAGGKQYRVEPNQTLDVDLMKADVGSTVDFGVLLVGGNGEVSIGTPEVDKAKVVAEVIEHGRDRKILVFKYKNKTRYRRRHGHRQDYTRLQIKEIVTEAGTFTEAGVKPKRAAPKRRRKAKAKPVAEETLTTEAAAPEAAAPTAEAPAEEAAKPKRASRTTAKKTTTAKKATTKRQPKKAAAKAEAEEPKVEEAPQPEPAPEAKEEPKTAEAPAPAPEAKEEPPTEEAAPPAPEAKDEPEETK
jgi:large subunit ribosomal protein L21